MKNTQYIVYNIAVSEITSCSMNYTIDFLLSFARFLNFNYKPTHETTNQQLNYSCSQDHI